MHLRWREAVAALSPRRTGCQRRAPAARRGGIGLVLALICRRSPHGGAAPERRRCSEFQYEVSGQGGRRAGRGLHVGGFKVVSGRRPWPRCRVAVFTAALVRRSVGLVDDALRSARGSRPRTRAAGRVRSGRVSAGAGAPSPQDHGAGGRARSGRAVRPPARAAGSRSRSDRG